MHGLLHHRTSRFGPEYTRGTQSKEWEGVKVPDGEVLISQENLYAMH